MSTTILLRVALLLRHALGDAVGDALLERSACHVSISLLARYKLCQRIENILAPSLPGMSELFAFSDDGLGGAHRLWVT